MEKFGARLARLRKSARMTQAELASACGWGEQQNRISNYETGRNEPSLADITSLAAALSVDPNALAFGEPEGHQVNETPIEYGPRVRNFRPVPVVGYAQLGPEGYWREMDYPAGAGDGYVDVPSADPNAYALRVRGDSMAPTIRNGWLVVVEPNSTPQPGELVLVCTSDEQCMVKELLWKRDGEISLGSINQDYKHITLEDTQITKLHHVTMILPPSKRKLMA